MNALCLVLGSYLNGYSIVDELYQNDIRSIIVMDETKEAAGYSNKIIKFIPIQNNPLSIKREIFKLNKLYNKLILYPNNDIYIKIINELYNDIKDFCLIAFNPHNATIFQDKSIQYTYCEKLNIPYPKSYEIKNYQEVEQLKNLSFPILIKPNLKNKTDTFRNIVISSKKELLENKKLIKELLKSNRLILSEIIPGDDDEIYAYTAYRDKNGNILGEWGGRKLSQFPNKFGTFSSAANGAPDKIFFLGRTLFKHMNLWGVNEAEFKYDKRDNKFKLIEINLRPMMWHRVGALSGVPLNYIQYLYLQGFEVPKYYANYKTRIHYVYLQYELINLLKCNISPVKLWHTLFKCDELHFAFWDKKDLLPSLLSFYSIIRKALRR